MSKTLTTILATLAVIVVLATIFFVATPTGRRMINAYDYSLEKADESNYETKKEVEDTARAYIVQYNTDVMIYKTYRDSNEGSKDYAEAARMRAIATATSYNEYIKKNSFIWKDNLPADIPISLSTEF